MTAKGSPVATANASTNWLNWTVGMPVGCVMLTVDDEGAGVPATALSQVFEPYFTTKRGGLGVGLSISRSIVEAHGGSIRAENLPHAGARFVVVLPAA